MHRSTGDHADPTPARDQSSSGCDRLGDQLDGAGVLERGDLDADDPAAGRELGELRAQAARVPAVGDGELRRHHRRVEHVGVEVDVERHAVGDLRAQAGRLDLGLLARVEVAHAEQVHARGVAASPASRPPPSARTTRPGTCRRGSRSASSPAC